MLFHIRQITLSHMVAKIMNKVKIDVITVTEMYTDCPTKDSQSRKCQKTGLGLWCAEKHAKLLTKPKSYLKPKIPIITNLNI